MNPHWRDRASCRDQAPDFDNHIDGESWTERDMRVKAAVATCLRCPVLAECKADIDTTLDDGVRAGMVLGRIHNVPAGGGRGHVAKPRKSVVHGDRFGARRHHRAGEKACQLCRDAEARYRQDQAKKKAQDGPKERDILPREHGTERGYRQHYNRNDKPVCRPCAQAHMAWRSEQQQAAGSARVWTAEEVAVAASSLPHEEVATRLGRSVDAVKTKRKKLRAAERATTREAA